MPIICFLMAHHIDRHGSIKLMSFARCIPFLILFICSIIHLRKIPPEGNPEGFKAQWPTLNLAKLPAYPPQVTR